MSRIKKAKTKKSSGAAHHHTTKKRLILDETIELNMDDVMHGVRNTSKIIKTPAYLPCSKKMQQLQDFRELTLNEILLCSIPKTLRFMFDVTKLTNMNEFNEDAPLQDGCKLSMFNNS